MESFPALEASLHPKHPMPAGSIKRAGPKTEGKKTSGILRIKKEELPSKTRPAAFDATKHPAWLAGGIGGAHVLSRPTATTTGGRSAAKTPIKPTKVAAAVSRKEATGTSIAPARSLLTEEDSFPSLLPSLVRPSSPLGPDDSTFVIGGEQPFSLPHAPHPSDRNTAAREDGTKRSRNKGKLVMSIGIKREEH